MSRLIFIAGPPGVGKSTVARALFERLEHAAWLDADDVWRIRPWVVEPRTTDLAERNVGAVLANYLQAGYEHVLLTWVLHRQDIVERLSVLTGQPPFLHVALICSADELLARREGRGERVHERALERLAQVRATRALLLDTTGQDPAALAALLLGHLREDETPETLAKPIR